MRSGLLRSVASLLHHVLRIVVCGTYEKVRWVHARSNIATMAHLETFRDWPIVKLPGHTMSQQVSSSPLSFVAAVNPDVSISIAESATCPFPAFTFRALPDFAGKFISEALANLRFTVGRVACAASAVATGRTEFDLALAYSGRVNVKGLAAGLTLKINPRPGSGTARCGFMSQVV